MCRNSRAGSQATAISSCRATTLVALKALLPYYAGQVKCIYIDPPYNTGNEGWAYNNNVDRPLIREWLGKTVGKEAEDLSKGLFCEVLKLVGQAADQRGSAASFLYQSRARVRARCSTL
jgi:hypothetical protein